MRLLFVKIFFIFLTSGNFNLRFSPLWAELLQKPPVKIAILGDSLTEGYGVADSEAYPLLAQALLKKEKRNITIINAGSSGSTSASAKSRLPWILKNNPDILMIALGANDGLRGIEPSSTKKNLIEVIKEARSKNVKVWLAGMKMPPNYGAPFTKKFAAIFSEIAKSENVPLLPFLLEGVAGQNNLNQADRIHPNAEGHKIISQNVAEFIKTQLDKGK